MPPVHGSNALSSFSRKQPVESAIGCVHHVCRPALLWFTGLSGSGKSTLASSFASHLHDLDVRSYVLDGDIIRKGLNKDLGLSSEDRVENIRRVAEVAKLMVDADLFVLAAFITPYNQSRAFIRELMRGWPYFECYVKCPLDVCEQRDPKGLYKKARGGILKGMTGIDAPFEEPGNPDLVIPTDKLSVEQCVELIDRFLLDRGILTEGDSVESLKPAQPFLNTPR